MALMNLFIHLNAYSDKKASNSPNLTNFKWVRDIQGIPAEAPVSQVVVVPAGGSVTVFENASKKFLYAECAKEAQIELNQSQVNTTIKPIVIGTSSLPGQFLLNADVEDLVITNPDSDNDIEVFIAHYE